MTLKERFTRMRDSGDAQRRIVAEFMMDQIADGEDADFLEVCAEELGAAAQEAVTIIRRYK